MDLLYNEPWPKLQRVIIEITATWFDLMDVPSDRSEVVEHGDEVEDDESLVLWGDLCSLTEEEDHFYWHSNQLNHNFYEGVGGLLNLWKGEEQEDFDLLLVSQPVNNFIELSSSGCDWMSLLILRGNIIFRWAIEMQTEEGGGEKAEQRNWGGMKFIIARCSRRWSQAHFSFAQLIAVEGTTVG